MGRRQTEEVVCTKTVKALRAMHKHIDSCSWQLLLWSNRYIPAIEESVIGIITEKYGENFAVDIGGPFTASLPVLAFEGATRRNRPNLQVWLHIGTFA